MSLFPPEAGWSAWPAPAKLNLTLQITGRRADGYHLLQTVFRLLAWGDRIHLRPRSDGTIRRVGTSAPGVAEADSIPGAKGVTADDIVAGLYGLAAGHLLRAFLF